MLNTHTLMSPVLLIMGTTNAFAHEINWPRGMSRQVAVGTCVKGP